MSDPSGWDVAHHWMKRLDELITNKSPVAMKVMSLEVDSPSCFACEKVARHKHKGTPKKVWDSSTLERAHVIARSTGGAMSADNLVMLCRDCHDEAPMTNDASVMLRWIAAREDHMAKQWRELRAACVAMEPSFLSMVDGVDVSKVSALLPQVLDEMSAGFHFGKGLTVGTKAAAAIEVVRRLTRAPSVGLRKGTAADGPLFG